MIVAYPKHFHNHKISGREVVFQCRDEGPLRVNVKWSRGNGAEGLPFPPGTRDFNGRLEIPDIKVNILCSCHCLRLSFHRWQSVDFQSKKFYF